MTEPFIPTGLVRPNTAQGFVAPQSMMSVPDMADAANTVIKDVMRVEPMIAGMAGMFVPGLSLVQPWIVMLVPYLERALDDISKGNNGDVLQAFIELVQHITKGQPVSAVLANVQVVPSSTTVPTPVSAVVQVQAPASAFPYPPRVAPAPPAPPASDFTNSSSLSPDDPSKFGG